MRPSAANSSTGSGGATRRQDTDLAPRAMGKPMLLAGFRFVLFVGLLLYRVFVLQLYVKFVVVLQCRWEFQFQIKRYL